MFVKVRVFRHVIDNVAYTLIVRVDFAYFTTSLRASLQMEVKRNNESPPREKRRRRKSLRCDSEEPRETAQVARSVRENISLLANPNR